MFLPTTRTHAYGRKSLRPLRILTYTSGTGTFVPLTNPSLCLVWVVGGGGGGSGGADGYGGWEGFSANGAGGGGGAAWHGWIHFFGNQSYAVGAGGGGSAGVQSDSYPATANGAGGSASILGPIRVQGGHGAGGVWSDDTGSPNYDPNSTNRGTAGDGGQGPLLLTPYNGVNVLSMAGFVSGGGGGHDGSPAGYSGLWRTYGFPYAYSAWVPIYNPTPSPDWPYDGGCSMLGLGAHGTGTNGSANAGPGGGGAGGEGNGGIGYSGSAGAAGRIVIHEYGNQAT